MIERVVNINVGVLGHVDSGKTALVAALSDILSTAALDKNPQSQERGITLDLGFSAYRMPCPEEMKTTMQADILQFTLVDCPGHASLIRTVLVGAQVLDIMILVVDCCKGVQAQTAECIVIGELLSSSLVVALNKQDLLPEEKRMKHLRRAGRNVLEALKVTRFANSEIVPLSAKPTNGESVGGVERLKDVLLSRLPLIHRNLQTPFLFMVDHCFAIKGQGTILTGTVLQGQVAVGDVVELPGLKLQRKIKNIQCFRNDVERICAGDRAGICLTQVPADKIERTMLSAINTVPTFDACICAVELCRFYKGQVLSKQKVHVNVGHQTCMAVPTFFGVPDGSGVTQDEVLRNTFKHVGKYASGARRQFGLKHEYRIQDQLFGFTGRPMELGVVPEDAEEEELRHFGPEWAILLFEKPVLAVENSVVLGTRFDMNFDNKDPACRIAFYGNIVHIFDQAADHKQISLYKNKVRHGLIDRMDPKTNTIIIRDMFKKESDLRVFSGCTVVAPTGETGVLGQPFGKSGKVKASFPEGLPPVGTVKVTLVFKKFVFDSEKRVHA